MSELDKFFDRDKPIPFIRMSNNPYKTNFPHAEERIRDVLDAYADCQEYVPRDKFRRKQWTAGARDFVDAHGEDGKLLKQAWELYLDIDWVRRQSIIISTPRSLISFAQKVKDNKIEAEVRDPDSEQAIEDFRKSWEDDKDLEWWDR